VLHKDEVRRGKTGFGPFVPVHSLGALVVIAVRVALICDLMSMHGLRRSGSRRVRWPKRK